MAIDKQLLKQFLRDYPFQPATAVWRGGEIAHVIHYPFPEGFGLDLGCGDGQLTKIIMDHVGSRKMVGIDIDPREAALAEKLSFYERIHVVPGDKIPELDQTFDWVFSNSVLEHIPNIDEVIKEVARLLKPGGIFLLTVPGDKFQQCLRGALLPWVSRKSYMEEVDARFACLRYWSAKDWADHLTPYGLKIERVTEYQTPAEAQRWETVARFTSGILYSFVKRRKQPIEIQQTIGVRKAGMKMPWFLTNILAELLAVGLETDQNKTAPVMGGLMILARKL